MATDNKDIQNQKVFVKLCSTLEVQANFMRLMKDGHDATTGGLETIN